MRQKRLLLVLALFVTTIFPLHQAHASDWVVVASPGTSYTDMDSSGSDTLMAVMSLDENIYVSSDGGKNWDTKSAPLGSSAYYYDVEVVSSTTAFLVAYGTTTGLGYVFKTEDLGESWSTELIQSGGRLYDLFMYSTWDEGYVVGDDGVIYKTDDSGSTWTLQSSGTSETLSAVHFYGSGTTGFAVGRNGALVMTTDGSTWTAVSSGYTDQFNDVRMSTSSVIWIASNEGYLLKSTNSGTSWSKVSVGGSPVALWEVEFINSNYGMVRSSTAFFGTTDGGSTWAIIDADYGSPAAIAFYANNVRWVADLTGDIYRYDADEPGAPEDFESNNSYPDPENDTTPILTWTAAEDNETGIASYKLAIDDGSYTDIGNVTSYTTTALSDGTHTILLRAVDEAGNMSDAVSLSVAIDATGPSVSTVTPTTVTAGTSTTMSVTVTDETGVASCALYIGGAGKGSMTYNATTGTYERAYTFTTAGSTSGVYAVCLDEAGNSTTGSSATITSASTTSGPDTTAPTVGALSPVSAMEDEATTLTATVSDDVGVSSCTLFVGGTSQGGMTIEGETASIEHTFSGAGSYTAYAQCRDGSGNKGTGASITIEVSSSDADSDSEEEEAADDAGVGNLLKIACAGSTEVNDPCRAVYYYADDGKRHAFPNEKVYFTWFDDFDDVLIVTDEFMASLSLGTNVTYHPGTKMVKFVTVNTVYAVSAGGLLRAIASEEVAKDVYGETWNQQIDDISDAFFGNYDFGDDIESADDYDPEEEETSVDSIDEDLAARS